jgi:hypothetical protein
VKVARDSPESDMQRFLRSHERLRRRIHRDVVDKGRLDV